MGIKKRIKRFFARIMAAITLTATAVAINGQNKPDTANNHDNSDSNSDIIVPIVTNGILISHDELMALPMDGKAWDQLVSDAGRADLPDLYDQSDKNDVYTLAAAIVSVRTDDAALRSVVVKNLMYASRTSPHDRTLSLVRNITPLVLAADVVGLSGKDEQEFKAFLSKIRNTTLSGKTLISTHNDRPNNWGTHAGAARVAVDLYLDDQDDLAQAITVFKCWLGEENGHKFKFAELDWQADPSKPKGINPRGSTKDGHNIDGVLPDDQRRSGGFRWPPTHENYAWEALQGTITTAYLLKRAGYSDVADWGDQALLRAVKWQYEINQFPPQGDDTFLIPLIEALYPEFEAGSVERTGVGKSLSYTGWLLALGN